MAASVQFRPQSRDLGMVMREVDEDLAIFLGMRNGEKETNGHLPVEGSHEFDYSKFPEPKPDSLDVSQPEIVPNAARDNFLNLETEKRDYNWFLTQPDSSLLPSLEVDVQYSAVDHANKTSDGDGIPSKSELGEESSPLSNNSSIQQPPTPTNEDSSTAANRKPLSSLNRKPAPRAATPMGRSGLPAKSKPSRASTPTSRATLLPSSKPSAGQPRSSTPSKATSRSSTPSKTAVPSVISKSKPSPTTSNDKPKPSSSGRKMGPAVCRSRGASPTVKSRPSKPSEMLSVSQDAPKVSMPKLRPASASRGRVSSTLSSSCNEKPRQRSCSPPKVRAPITTTAYKTSGKILSRNRGCGDDGDDVNPVVMGTKMVDRVVSMRKLAPPKQDDDYVSHDHNLKKSSSGFGRSLSKKSLDMAIRHLDIRRSIPEKLRPIAAGKISPASLSESINFQ